MKHETRNTTGILRYCNKCGKNTMHTVSDKRVGLCMKSHASGLSKDQDRRMKAREKEDAQPRLI